MWRGKHIGPRSDPLLCSRALPFPGNISVYPPRFFSSPSVLHCSRHRLTIPHSAAPRPIPLTAATAAATPAPFSSNLTPILPVLHRPALPSATIPLSLPVPLARFGLIGPSQWATLLS